MTQRTLLLSLACLLATAAGAQVRQTLDEGWQFVRTDLTIWEVLRPVKAGKPESVPLWTAVSLPHCYNADDGVDPTTNYYEGPAWYRTTLNIDNPYPNGHTLLEFEGAGQKTDVYVGTQKVGSHIGGYDRWTVDITDAGRGGAL